MNWQEANQGMGAAKELFSSAQNRYKYGDVFEASYDMNITLQEMNELGEEINDLIRTADFDIWGEDAYQLMESVEKALIAAEYGTEEWSKLTEIQGKVQEYVN